MLKPFKIVFTTNLSFDLSFAKIKNLAIILEHIRTQLNILSEEKRKNTNQFCFKTGNNQYGENDIFLGVSMPQLRNLIQNYVDLDLCVLRDLLHQIS